MCHVWAWSLNQLDVTKSVFWLGPCACIFALTSWDTWPALCPQGLTEPLGAWVTLTVSVCQAGVWLSSLPLPSMNEPHCCSQLDTKQGKVILFAPFAAYIKSACGCTARVDPQIVKFCDVQLSDKPLQGLRGCGLCVCWTTKVCSSVGIGSCGITERRILTGWRLSYCLASVNLSIISALITHCCGLGYLQSRHQTGWLSKGGPSDLLVTLRRRFYLQRFRFLGDKHKSECTWGAGKNTPTVTHSESAN